MKSLSIFILATLSLCSFGQRGKDVLLSVDTLKGEDTVYVYANKTTGTYNSLTLTSTYTEIGGTSDGTMWLEGGTIDPTTGDTLWVLLTSDNCIVDAEPNDTITIEDGLTATFVVWGTPLNLYRHANLGTVGDTTKVVTIYNLK